MCEIELRVHLSEGSFSKKSNLKFCTCFQRILVGAVGVGCLRSNLECDFQRGLIAKKIV